MQFSAIEWTRKKMRLIEDRRKNEYKNNNFHVFIRITQTIYIVSTGKEEKLNWKEMSGKSEDSERNFFSSSFLKIRWNQMRFNADDLLANI